MRELARVATPETEREWLNATRGRTVHEVERLVSGKRRGARPGDEVEASARRHTLHFEVSAETFATFREAIRALRQKSDGRLDDDSALLLMAREVLGGPGDEGKSSYQVAVNICERCGAGSQDAAGEVIPLDAAIVAMAHCDAQHVRRIGHHRTHVGASARATQSIPPAIRRQVMRRDHGRCVVPGCRHATFVDVHHIETRADGGGHTADNLIVLCTAHHRALHHGQLDISGRVSQRLVFRRSDGSDYGALNAPLSADIGGRAFRGLRNMGFGEREARHAIERTRSAGDIETVLRRALAVLTERGPCDQSQRKVSI